MWALGDSSGRLATQVTLGSVAPALAGGGGLFCFMESRKQREGHGEHTAEGCAPNIQPPFLFLGPKINLKVSNNGLRIDKMKKNG